MNRRPSGHTCGRRRAGVTLLEVLVALAIVALVAGGVYEGTGTVTTRLARVKRTMLARALLERKLAELETSPLPLGVREGSFGNEYPAYAWRTTIEPGTVRDVTLPGLYRVGLRVSWDDPWDRDALTVETLVAGSAE